MLVLCHTTDVAQSTYMVIVINEVGVSLIFFLLPAKEVWPFRSSFSCSVGKRTDRDEILVRQRAPEIEPDVQRQGPAPRGLQPRPPAPPAAGGPPPPLDTSLQVS